MIRNTGVHGIRVPMVTLGIGQDMMLSTPLQMANSICIVANKGYFYTPHFVEKVRQRNIREDTLLNKFRKSMKCLRIFLMNYMKQ